jgi:hypothetical protein
MQRKVQQLEMIVPFQKNAIQHMSAKSFRARTRRTMQRISIVCLLSMAACSSLHDQSLPSAGLAEATTLHAVQDARLRHLMREMNSLMFERMRTELELDQERRQKAVQIGRIADEMAQTVVYIIDSLPRLSLNEHEETAFLTLAERLRNQVKLLQEQAEHNYLDAIPGTLRHITTTCTMCHQLFRKPVDRRQD